MPQDRAGLLPETGFDMQVLIPDGIFANSFGSPPRPHWEPGVALALYGYALNGAWLWRMPFGGYWAEMAKPACAGTQCAGFWGAPADAPREPALAKRRVVDFRHPQTTI
jgi:hypothetical protein